MLPPTPGASPEGGAGAGAGAPPGQPPQPPMGMSPATQPTPNSGLEMQAIVKLGSVVQQLTEILPLAGVGTELGAAVLKVLATLSKHIPPGTSSPASTANHLQQAQIKNVQNGALSAQLQQRGQQPGAPAQAPPMMSGAG